MSTTTIRAAGRPAEPPARSLGRLVVRIPALPTMLLWLVLAVAFGVRLAGIRSGLPFSYNPDEEQHFVPYAARAADGHLNPGYFENPTGLTYLLAVVLRVAFLGEDVTQRLADDPASVFLVARVTVALLGTLLVGLVHWAGRRYAGRAVGLVAAALMAVGFLPVFYSHQALNDVPTLIPVTVALVACLDVYERGDRRSYLLAGAAVGAAVALKYTAAPLALTVAVAAAAGVARRRQRPAYAVKLLVLSGVACVVAIVVLAPFLFLDPGTAWSQLDGQSAQASTTKLGQQGTGWTYYPGSLLWGLGVLPVVLAVVGLVVAARIHRVRALLMALFPAVLYLYLGGQGRFFGRWLMPAYPSLVILSGLGVVATGRWLRARVPHGPGTRLLGRAVVPLVVAATLAQPVADAVRSDVLAGRTDTRTQARQWLTTHLARGTRVVVEPAVPAHYLDARAARELGGEALTTYPVARPFQSYEARLSPSLLDVYRRQGYCWVMVNSFQRDRGLAAGLPGARAFYRRLETEAERTVVFSPYRPGASVPPFSYDLRFNWYPRAYVRPGPYVELVRLSGCDG